MYHLLEYVHFFCTDLLAIHWLGRLVQTCRSPHSSGQPPHSASSFQFNCMEIHLHQKYESM